MNTYWTHVQVNAVWLWNTRKPRFESWTNHSFELDLVKEPVEPDHTSRCTGFVDKSGWIGRLGSGVNNINKNTRYQCRHHVIGFEVKEPRKLFWTGSVKNNCLKEPIPGKESVGLHFSIIKWGVKIKAMSTIVNFYTELLQTWNE